MATTKQNLLPSKKNLIFTPHVLKIYFWQFKRKRFVVFYVHLKGFRGNFEVLSTHMIFNLWEKKQTVWIAFHSPYRGESFWNDALRERQLHFTGKRKKSFRTKMRQFVVFVKFVDKRYGHERTWWIRGGFIRWLTSEYLRYFDIMTFQLKTRISGWKKGLNMAYDVDKNICTPN